MRHLKTLAPLAVAAGLLAACGNSSSSSSSADTGVAVSSTMQLRPVSARYAQDTTQGQEQLGPQAPKALVDTMKGFDCASAQPAVVEGKLMECDPARNVYLLDPPLVSGGVKSAVPLQIGHGKQWYIKLTLDDGAAGTVSKQVDSDPGSELAVVLKGKVLTALVVDSSMKDGHFGITGLDKSQATSIAQELQG